MPPRSPAWPAPASTGSPAPESTRSPAPSRPCGSPGASASGRGVVLLLGGLAVAYVAARAFLLSMTCDEAWSASGFPQPSLFAFLTPEFIAPLNTHLLNSWLINLSLTLFGRHDWAVRLPALCGGVLYIVLACRFALGAATSWRGPALAALLLANPYLLDFLSLARGYSLGLCFMMLGLPLLLDRDRERYAWAPVPLALAALSNLSFLYPYLASLAIVWGLLLLGAKRTALSHLGKALLPSLCTLAALWTVYGTAMRLAMLRGEHWWGSHAGFVDGTIASLVQVTLYERSLQPWVYASVARALASALVVISLLVMATGRGPNPGDGSREKLGRILLLFFIVWAGIVTEHALFGTPFVKERGALFLYPVIVAAMVLSAQYCRSIPGLSAMANTLAGVLTLCCVTNAACNVNLDHTATWSMDACARHFMETIDKNDHIRNFTHDTVTMASNLAHERTIEYYLGHKMMRYVTEILPAERMAEADYIISRVEDVERLTGQGRAAVVATCGYGNAVLLRKVR